MTEKNKSERLAAESTLTGMKEAELECLLNEFNSLRAEFLSRLNTENILVLGALTFLGTILGIAFKDSGSVNYDILLIVPPLMSLIGIFYINQRLSNTAIGLYVRDYLRRDLSKLVDTEVFNWEVYVRDNTSLVKELTVFVFILLVFTAPSCAILFSTYKVVYASSDFIKMIDWWFGIVLSVIFSVLWFSAFGGWFGKKRKKS